MLVATWILAIATVVVAVEGMTFGWIASLRLGRRRKLEEEIAKLRWAYDFLMEESFGGPRHALIDKGYLGTEAALKSLDRLYTWSTTGPHGSDRAYVQEQLGRVGMLRSSGGPTEAPPG